MTPAEDFVASVDGKGPGLERSGHSQPVHHSHYPVSDRLQHFSAALFPGYSFTDFRASLNQPANFVGLANYREILRQREIWNNFWVTAKYVIVSVGGQMIVGFGLALLLNRPMPAKGLSPPFCSCR